jgi:hypothetical protein
MWQSLRTAKYSRDVMLELIKFFLGKLDFLAISQALRKNENRRIAARLHLILVQSYEVIEIYQVLLDELKAALESYQKVRTREHFFLNPARIESLLKRQASNLQIIEHLTFDLFDELRILDNKFLETYRSLLPGKFGILFEAQHLLSRGRLSLSESDPDNFPATIDGEYRSLWFTWEKPPEDRKEIEKYLYGYNGEEKVIFDINNHDGDVFFQELSRYFEKEDPMQKLKEIETITENYKNVLQQNFSIEDLLAEMGKVRKHSNWAKPN